MLFAFPLREISSHNGEGKLRSDFLRGPDRHPLAASGRVLQVCLRGKIYIFFLCLLEPTVVDVLVSVEVPDAAFGSFEKHFHIFSDSV